jgi:hypothetical protein
MAKKTHVKVSGVWRTVKNVWVKESGVWKSKIIPKGKISGIWKEFISYFLGLYEYGENDLLTREVYDQFNVNSVLTITRNSNNIYIAANTIWNHSDVSVRNENPIDLTDFSKIVVEYHNSYFPSKNDGGIKLVVTTNPASFNNTNTGNVIDVFMPTSTGSVTQEIDISSLSGQYYVAFGIGNDYGGDKTSAYVYLDRLILV